MPEIYEGIVQDRRRRSRAGRAQQDRRHHPRRGRRSGRRLRRHEGLARAGRGAGAARREDRHRAVRPRPGALRHQRHPAGRGEQGHRRRGRPPHGARGSRREALAWPSAARARTCASRRSSPAGSSTSSARPSSSRWRRRASVRLREIDGVDEDLAKAMYRLGFRALEEVAEAQVEELAQIQGVGTPRPRRSSSRARRARWSGCATSASSRRSRGPSRSPSARSCASCAASACAPCSCSKRPATARSRISRARTRIGSPSRPASASRRRASPAGRGRFSGARVEGNRSGARPAAGPGRGGGRIRRGGGALGFVPDRIGSGGGTEVRMNGSEHDFQASRQRLPERTCAGAAKQAAPSAMVRVVLGPDGSVVPDLGRARSGAAPGCTRIRSAFGARRRADSRRAFARK